MRLQVVAPADEAVFDVLAKAVWMDETLWIFNEEMWTDLLKRTGGDPSAEECVAATAAYLRSQSTGGELQLDLTVAEREEDGEDIVPRNLLGALANVPAMFVYINEGGNTSRGVILPYAIVRTTDGTTRSRVQKVGDDAWEAVLGRGAGDTDRVAATTVDAVLATRGWLMGNAVPAPGRRP